MNIKTTINKVICSLSLPWGIFVLCVVLSPQAKAFTENYVPAAGDYVFYTFALSGAAFSVAVITAYREYRWLLYVLFAVLLLANSASFDGVLAYFLGQHDFVLWVVPYLLTSTTAAYGFFMIALNLEPPHPFARFKRIFIALAITSALFPLTSVFWLGKLSLALMWRPVNVLFFTMVLAQILPPLTWQSSDRLLNLLTRVFPVVVGLFAVIAYSVHYFSSGFSQTDLNGINRILLLLFAFFSITIVIWQAFESHRSKDLAERKALEAARSAAEMQLALMKAEKEYEEAKAVASRHRSQLAFVSHDLKQPITALRVVIDQLQRVEKKPGADHLTRAVDYIESLSRSYISEDRVEEEGTEQHVGKESVSTAVFAQTLKQMFAEEAMQKKIRFDVRCADYPIVVEPLSTMRVMTNLIGNALTHAEATRLLVGFRLAGNRVVFQVHDNGLGMDDETLARSLLSGVKGPDSEGQGLGLKIVQELCSAQDMPFTICSILGRGTSAYVELLHDRG